MKLRTIAIATIFLALILSASPLGYCYSNVVAAKTTNDVSDYQSTSQISLSPDDVAAITSFIITQEGITMTWTTFCVISMSDDAEIALLLGGAHHAALTAAIDAGLAAGAAPIIPSYMGSIALIGLGVTIAIILITVAGIYVFWSCS